VDRSSIYTFVNSLTFIYTHRVEAFPTRRSIANHNTPSQLSLVGASSRPNSMPCADMFLGCGQAGRAKQCFPHRHGPALSTVGTCGRCELCLPAAREEAQCPRGHQLSSGRHTRQLFRHWPPTDSAAQVPQAAQCSTLLITEWSVEWITNGIRVLPTSYLEGTHQANPDPICGARPPRVWVSGFLESAPGGFICHPCPGLPTMPPHCASCRGGARIHQD